ncbi:MAG: c-type cytochrome biogenesis protein CcsB [Deltaproteobacteria bacterium]|nr:c-type cytochrome biogenesis protein CcsB [Candidatus Tharpella aukensis]
MDIIYTSLLGAALTLYTLSMVTGFVHLFRPWPKALAWSKYSIQAGFAFHLLAFLFRCGQTQTLAVTNMPESFSFFALLLTMAFLLVNRKKPMPILGTFISPLLIIFTLWAVVTSHTITPQPPILKSFWLPLHVLLSFAGNAFLALGCGVAVIYLLQEHLIKKKKIKGIFRKLPALQRLDELNYLCLRLGFPLLTLGIISGSVWASYAWGSHWSWDPKETWSLITWLLFAALLHGRMNSGWRGRKASLLTIIGFAAIMFTFLGVNLLLSGLHSYVH